MSALRALLSKGSLSCRRVGRSAAWACREERHVLLQCVLLLVAASIGSCKSCTESSSVCAAVSGHVPEEPVINKTTGHIYEKRLIEKTIQVLPWGQ